MINGKIILLHLRNQISSQEPKYIQNVVQRETRLSNNM